MKKIKSEAEVSDELTKAQKARLEKTPYSGVMTKTQLRDCLSRLENLRSNSGYTKDGFNLLYDGNIQLFKSILK